MSNERGREAQDGSSGDASDADSDLEELQGDIAKFDESVREFLASQRDEGSSSKFPTRGGSRGRGARGSRKAAKPRGDITARLSRVNQAFLSGDYARALDLAFEIIRINAETHQAWTSLASIFREQGDAPKALSAMVYAAHLRPKDVSGWMQCASYALDTVHQDEDANLHTARLCYSAALRADHTNTDARLGKALVCHRQGHLASAITEYGHVLKHRPYDLELVRKLAEACVDNKHAETAVPAAIQAYERYFEHGKTTGFQDMTEAPWHDVGIFVELFASAGRYFEAIRELKALSRYFLGRGEEEYWQDWQNDDREWDAGDERRMEVPEYAAQHHDPEYYGTALPQDLRVRLAIYRLRLNHEGEALKHLEWFEPTADHTKDFVADFPFLAFDIAEELARSNQVQMAIKYYNLLRELPGDPDAAILLSLGKCYGFMNEDATAEEFFLAAIDADEDNIDARIELANMYEKTREEEEALILAAEAMALREARGQDGTTGENIATTPESRLPGKRDGFARREKVVRKRAPAQGKSLIPRRYRPKRLAGPDKRKQDEQARAMKLTQQYEVVRDLKRQIRAGREDLVSAWKTSSEELIDDFRSLKKFYTWEKYLHFLGTKMPLLQLQGDQPRTELVEMYQRLARTFAPNDGNDGGIRTGHDLENHQGISFDNWLELFLDYAIGLAVEHRREEAYQVCEAARDSTAFQSAAHGFMVHVAWGVCAIYTSDEERCVATARHLMRDGAMTDSYRMFALLSSLCHSPVSWYTSGPAQKFILRQIKAMDEGREIGGPPVATRGDGSFDGTDRVLDACLLMLYGHILFTSTSYTYALGYFLRARSLDPNNPMVNLSLGLAYVHYGLKRQSTNRQYLLLQGQTFLSRYLEVSCDLSVHAQEAEAYYNVGRLYQLLGINYLAIEYYAKAAEAAKAHGGHVDLEFNIRNNELMSLLHAQNTETALLYLKKNLRI